MNMHSSFISQLKQTFPALGDHNLTELISENMISDFHIELQESVLKQAQDFIHTTYALRQSSEYKNALASQISEKKIQDPGNKSMMMSYDFHLAEDGNLKLIEINTNAAFLLLGEQMYGMLNLPVPNNFHRDDIRTMIQDELHLQGKDIPLPHICITDENPAQQKLYPEFLAYNELFKSWGWNSEILDYKDIFKNSKPDFIYNRYTDFFLTDPSSQELREKFLDRSVCFSPNPYEYFMLADKQRMIEWVSADYMKDMPLTPEERELIHQVVPFCTDLHQDNASKIWEERKKYFIKPKNAFGSKQSYRGSSVSRKTFEGLLGGGMIAQEYIAPPEVEFETPTGPQKFKYDLRFYVYQDRLQLVLARIYQGQVTNLRTPHGGFAPVIFK